MSVAAVKAAVDTAAPSLAAKLVMLVLAYHHNGETGLCFPSYERMAEESGLNKSSVIRAVKELEGAQLLRKKQGRRAGKRSASNHYTLVFMHARLVEDRTRFSGVISRAPQPQQEVPTSTAKASEVGSRRKRSHKRLAKRRIEPTWRPSTQLVASAKSHGFTSEEIERMILDFRDYYLARGEISAAWGIDFSRWIRRQVDIREQQHERQARTGPSGRGEQRLADLAGDLGAAHEAVRRGRVEG